MSAAGGGIALGDVENAVVSLERSLRTINTAMPDRDAIMTGDPRAYLPLFHHILLDYSPHVAGALTSKGYRLMAKSDQRFMELVWRLLLREFDIRPSLSVQQFFAPGFAVRKIQVVQRLVDRCRRLHVAMEKAARPRGSAASERGKRSGHPEPHRVDHTLQRSPMDISSSSSSQLKATAAGSTRPSTAPAKSVPEPRPPPRPSSPPKPSSPAALPMSPLSAEVQPRSLECPSQAVLPTQTTPTDPAAGAAAPATASGAPAAAPTQPAGSFLQPGSELVRHVVDLHQAILSLQSRLDTAVENMTARVTVLEGRVLALESAGART
mmetsp:Transcript_18279/g.58342  ORF Transcript_18279/g.58342 Transcript_18279/m.58342 type:complete len:323 (-) Transcript_18279:102-1070(-)